MIYDNKEKIVDKKVIAIIIPVFNGLNYTKECLNSLSRILSGISSSGVDFEIIVVDDGSKDGTASWVTQNHPAVHLLYGDGTLWWSGGINKGMRYAKENLNADYFLWWNNDIQPADDYFDQLLKLIQSTSSNILIGSKIFILNENKIWGMGGRFSPTSGRRYMYGEQQEDGDAFRKPFEVDWFPGMGTLMHRDVFDKIGLLDADNFPQYHGDSDYTFRTKKAGFTLIAFPQLVIHNDNSNSGLKHEGRSEGLYKTLTNIKSNYNLRKDIIFYRKHTNSPLAYVLLFNKYFRYIGGFYKWKFLNAFGINKPSNDKR